MSNPLKIPCIILSATSLLSLSAAAMLAVSNNELRKNAVPTEVMVIAPAETETVPVFTEPPVSETEPVNEETSVTETEAVTETSIPEGTVYIYDNGIEVVEYPEITGAVMNDYDMSLLKTDEKKHKFLYDENGNLRSRFGIDVSSYQCDIDWNAAAADGVEFAYIRCGYRGYETGKLCEDKYFRRNIAAAREAGVETGVYFYSQAINTAEAEEEAYYVLDLLSQAGAADMTLPIVFDWEFPTDEDPARTDDMTHEMQQQCAEAFCAVIRNAGYEPMYYATINTAIFRYDMGKLADVPLWMAEYRAETDFVYAYKMWQYSCSGVIDGIDGLVDLNILID